MKYYQANLKYWQGEVYLRFGQYDNGRIAIQLFSHSEVGPIAKVTVNMVDRTILGKDEIIVKCYGENEGMDTFLIENDICFKAHTYHDNGNVICPVMKLKPEILKEVYEQIGSKANS